MLTPRREERNLLKSSTSKFGHTIIHCVRGQNSHLTGLPRHGPEAPKINILLGCEISFTSVRIRFRLMKVPESRDATQPKDDLDPNENEEQPDDPNLTPAQFPLAKLFEDEASAPGLEIRLTILRTEKGKNNSFIWNWPAATYFLSGRRDYKVVTKAQRTAEINDMTLDEWLIESGDAVPWAWLREIKRPGTSCEWNLKPKL